uniref:hypothetical protein n=1 Tax=Marinobacterium profundum TaxID=1714300 RepID=UPI000A6A5BFF|nr:hypothetical protein [Marinobacterium profundum]
MIIKDYSGNIESFERFLISKLCSVEEITGNDSALYKKIIYVSFIDSLAACVFPRKGNRDRFISTIERFSHWDDRNRVSITHLGKYVYSNPHPSLSDVRKYVGPVLERWRERQNENIFISEDPRLSDTDIKHISWKKDKESGIDLSIDSFTHSNLLYKMRNALVHQFQSRADEILPSDPKEPFYQVINQG